MANKVTFDYSKASSFIQEHEMEYMSRTGSPGKGQACCKDRRGK